MLFLIYLFKNLELWDNGYCLIPKWDGSDYGEKNNHTLYMWVKCDHVKISLSICNKYKSWKNHSFCETKIPQKVIEVNIRTQLVNIKV